MAYSRNDFLASIQETLQWTLKLNHQYKLDLSRLLNYLYTENKAKGIREEEAERKENGSAQNEKNDLLKEVNDEEANAPGEEKELAINPESEEDVLHLIEQFNKQLKLANFLYKKNYDPLQLATENAEDIILRYIKKLQENDNEDLFPNDFHQFIQSVIAYYPNAFVDYTQKYAKKPFQEIEREKAEANKIHLENLNKQLRRLNKKYPNKAPYKELEASNENIDKILKAYSEKSILDDQKFRDFIDTLEDQYHCFIDYGKTTGLSREEKHFLRNRENDIKSEMKQLDDKEPFEEFLKKLKELIQLASGSGEDSAFILKLDALETFLSNNEKINAVFKNIVELASKLFFPDEMAAAVAQAAKKAADNSAREREEKERAEREERERAEKRKAEIERERRKAEERAREEEERVKAEREREIADRARAEQERKEREAKERAEREEKERADRAQAEMEREKREREEIEKLASQSKEREEEKEQGYTNSAAAARAAEATPPLREASPPVGAPPRFDLPAAHRPRSPSLFAGGAAAAAAQPERKHEEKLPEIRLRLHALISQSNQENENAKLRYARLESIKFSQEYFSYLEEKEKKCKEIINEIKEKTWIITSRDYLNQKLNELDSILNIKLNRPSTSLSKDEFIQKIEESIESIFNADKKLTNNAIIAFSEVDNEKNLIHVLVGLVERLVLISPNKKLNLLSDILRIANNEYLPDLKNTILKILEYFLAIHQIAKSDKVNQLKELILFVNEINPHDKNFRKNIGEKLATLKDIISFNVEIELDPRLPIIKSISLSEADTVRLRNIEELVDSIEKLSEHAETKALIKTASDLIKAYLENRENLAAPHSNFLRARDQFLKEHPLKPRSIFAAPAAADGGAAAAAPAASSQKKGSGV